MLYVITSLSHILYYLIWNYPYDFIFFAYDCRVTPVTLMSSLSYIQKIFQFLFIIYYSFTNDTLIPYFENLNILNILLIGIGQTLNLSVYYKLGTKGVYYGNKFGLELPYITTFPYNIGIKNPQYVGCILTLCGLYPLISFNYVIYASTLYQITMYVESY